MPSIIKYVTGVPDERDTKAISFDELKDDFALDKEKSAVYLYDGPLSEDDFDALFFVLTSEEYREIKLITDEVRSNFIKLVQNDAFYSSYRRDLRSAALQRTTDHFHRLIREILSQPEKTGYMEVCDLVIDQAKRDGKYRPISYYYPTGGIETEILNPGGRTLVLVDDKLCGDVTLGKTEKYFDQGVGPIEKGVARVKVLDCEEHVNWNSWLCNFLWSNVDPVIRKKILKEKNKGVIFFNG